MFGIVHYIIEGSEQAVVECFSEAGYRNEVDKACRWAEEATDEGREVWGEVLEVAA